MRILYYNWVDYLDPEKRGGGVSLYQRNLVTQLGARADIEVFFLTSGISYDPFDNRPRVEPIRHGPTSDKGRRFELINSGVLSPGHHSFGHDSQIEHPATTKAFFDFLEKHGPFDVVHFNNLEGIPAEALTLKSRFPGIRVIYSLHNYYPLCPQVNLWHRERENCLDFENGAKCTDCLVWRTDAGEVRQANSLAYLLKRSGILPGTRAFDRIFPHGVRLLSRWLRLSRRWSERSRQVLAYEADARSTLDGSGELPYRRLTTDAGRFRRRRDRITAIMNENCDRVLCVSGRVRLVAEKFGIAPELLQTSYIGTLQAETFHATPRRTSFLKPDGTITLAFLGYMRRDKGFHFLMKALTALPEDVADRVRLLIGARAGDAEAMQLLERTTSHIREVLFADGYQHDQLDVLLAEANVGVIPVQWEDNLPQVAIEMHARRLPLLTSDLGGAKELHNTPEMVFRSDSVDSFRKRIEALLAGEVDMDAYWRNATAPVSMQEHEAELLSVYRDALGTTAGHANVEPIIRAKRA